MLLSVCWAPIQLLLLMKSLQRSNWNSNYDIFSLLGTNTADSPDEILTESNWNSNYIFSLLGINSADPPDEILTEIQLKFKLWYFLFAGHQYSWFSWWNPYSDLTEIQLIIFSVCWAPIQLILLMKSLQRSNGNSTYNIFSLLGTNSTDPPDEILTAIQRKFNL
jgi:hypothetical protein